MVALSEEEGISHLPFVLKAKEVVKIKEESQLQMVLSSNNYLSMANHDVITIENSHEEEENKSPKEKVRPVSLPRMYESPINKRNSSIDWSNLVGGMHISGVVRDRERQSFEMSLISEKKKEKWKLMKVKEERHAMEGLFLIIFFLF